MDDQTPSARMAIKGRRPTLASHTICLDEVPERKNTSWLDFHLLFEGQLVGRNWSKFLAHHTQLRQETPPWDPEQVVLIHGTVGFCRAKDDDNEAPSISQECARATHAGHASMGVAVGGVWAEHARSARVANIGNRIFPLQFFILRGRDLRQRRQSPPAQTGLTARNERRTLSSFVA